jgi:hypothetical protein
LHKWLKTLVKPFIPGIERAMPLSHPWGVCGGKGTDHNLRHHTSEPRSKAFREKPVSQIFAKRSAPLNRCTRSAFS